MTDAVLRLKEEILRLPFEDQLDLANYLWDSLGPPIDEKYADEEAWIEELERRSRKHEADPTKARPFREVMEELRQESTPKHQLP